jgi:TP901 family phage tail tape measure protein
MSDDTTLGVGIEANVSGTQETKALADAVESVGDALRVLVSNAKSAVAATDRVASSLAGTSGNAKSAAKDVKNLAQEFKSAAAAQESLSASEYARQKAASIPKPLAVQATEATAAARAKAAQLIQSDFEKYQKESSQRVADFEIAELKRVTAANRTEYEKQTLAAVASERAKETAAKALSDRRDELRRLTNARYALYDVANSATIAGAALIGFNVAAVGAAAQYETAMAQISRTTGATGQQLEGIRSDFVDLAQTIPVAFGELSKIGTLAGQLNIPADQVAQFTKTTAEFSATTNVSSEAAATAMGRLDTLLPDVRGNYEGLGSAILQVGVNSVATETEIINTTSQIAAAGAQAGFTADQVIGLAGAFASLGVAPEAARGTTVRVFSEITTAVTQGGESLDKFAQLAGMTAQQFQQAWGQDAGGTFISVLQGLQSEGSGAETTLRGLGITAVRDINALLRLSQNVDLVKDSFGNANSGFTDGTQLSAAFGVQAATVASKIQLLVNSVQALFAELGQSGLGPVGFFIDSLTNAAKVLTTLADNPAAQWIAALAGAFTITTGAALLLSAAFIRATTTTIAMRTAFADMQKEAIAAGGGLAGFSAALYGTSAAAKVLRTALITTGIGALVVVAGAAIGGITEWASSFKSAADVAKERYGDFEGLATALDKDTAAAKDGAEVYGTIKGNVSTTTQTTQDWVGTLQDTVGAQVNLTDSMVNSNTKIKEQSYAIGENTAAWLANKVANDEAIQNLYKAAPTLATGFATKLAKGDTAGAKKIYDDFYAKAQASAAIDFNTGSAIINPDTQTALDNMKTALDSVSGSLQVAADKTQLNTALADSLGLSYDAATGQFGQATDALDGMTEAADGAAQELSELRDAISSGFSQQNAIGDLQKDFYNLIYTIADAGTSFDAFDAVGSGNLANLQDSIVSTITAGKALGIDATTSVSALFLQLQKSGVDTANLLASLSRIKLPGVNINTVKSAVSGQSQLTGAGQKLSGVLDQIRSNAYGAAAAEKEVGSAAATAAPKVVTLADYASDLAGVFNRSFELRFGNQQALDTISTGWAKIAQTTASANKEIADAQRKLDSLTADKSIQEYFLSVAQDYGDSLRAGEIAADIADINADMVDQQQKVADAQAKSSKELDGNSEAAINNRDTLSDLVKDYQGYLTSLASSGLSQDQLQQKSAQLRDEFVRQATQLGYSRDQVETFARSFDDMAYAIARVPRNITVYADANPAIQALNEFQAKIRETNDRASEMSGKTYTAPRIVSPAVLTPVGNPINGSDVGITRRALDLRNDQGLILIGNQLYKNGYKEGGYTGGGMVNDVAGVVHKKEFVVDAPNTARLGLPFLNALNNGSTPVAPSASMPNMIVVEFSAYDRQLIADNKNVQVVIPGTAIQSATNAANLNAANRGAS